MRFLALLLFAAVMSDLTQAGAAVRKATFRLSLSGRAHPSVPRPKPQTHESTVADNEVLKLIPPGELARTDYFFRVRIEGQTVRLTQIPDDARRMTMFSFDEGDRTHNAEPGAPFQVEKDKPVVIYLNVPGGGPEWTITLLGIE